MALQLDKTVSDAEFRAQLIRLLYAHGLASQKPTDEEIENAVIRYKRKSNEEGKKTGRTLFFIEDGVVNFFLLEDMGQTLDRKLRWMCHKEVKAHSEAQSQIRELYLVGFGFVASICAYYWGKRSSVSRAQLSVSGRDSSINLPGYG